MMSTTKKTVPAETWDKLLEFLDVVAKQDACDTEGYDADWLRKVLRDLRDRARNLHVEASK